MICYVKIAPNRVGQAINWDEPEDFIRNSVEVCTRDGITYSPGSSDNVFRMFEGQVYERCVIERIDELDYRVLPNTGFIYINDDSFMINGEDDCIRLITDNNFGTMCSIRLEELRVSGALQAAGFN